MRNHSLLWFKLFRGWWLAVRCVIFLCLVVLRPWLVAWPSVPVRLSNQEYWQKVSSGAELFHNEISIVCASVLKGFVCVLSSCSPYPAIVARSSKMMMRWNVGRDVVRERKITDFVRSSFAVVGDHGTWRVVQYSEKWKKVDSNEQKCEGLPWTKIETTKAIEKVRGEREFVWEDLLNHALIVEFCLVDIRNLWWCLLWQFYCVLGNISDAPISHWQSLRYERSACRSRG